MATTDPFQYTNCKLDTVEAGIEVVKAKVGLVDDKIGVMADDWRMYGSKINELEDNIHYHDTKMDEFRTREEIHSAKLRKLEEELSKLRVHNTRLQDELLVMQKSPRVPMDDRDRPNYIPTTDKNDTDKRHVDFQRDQLSHRDTYRERMYGPDIENRYNTRDNDRFRNTDKGRQAEATSRREVDKIQLHDGNFKPWARNAYQNPYHNPPKSTNSGVYLFMRTHMDGKSDVVKALKEGRSVLANSYGQLKGIANNTEIHLLEGRPDGWTHVPSSKSERTWDVGDTVIIFWFPTRKEAEMWLYHEKKFQRASFPEYHGSDMACLPINWNPENDRHYPTFLVTEYEGIVDPDQFREKFVANMYDVLQRHKAERFVIQTVGIKMFRGNWFKQRSVVTCNRFPSSQAALEFYNDPDYERLRRSVRDISKSRTTFIFTLTERPV